MTTFYVRAAGRLSPLAQARVEAANKRLIRQLRHPIRIEWDFHQQQNRWRASSRVMGSSGRYLASAEGRSAAGLVDELADALLRQRRRVRRKVKTTRRRGSLRSVAGSLE